VHRKEGRKKEEGQEGQEAPVINPNCPICHGLGWVCENHPHLAWTNEPSGWECGPGMKCECQRSADINAGIEKPELSAVLVSDDVKVEDQHSRGAHDQLRSKIYLLIRR
jgi:hypothetical protein